MALAQIAEIERLKLVERSAELGALLLEKLRTLASPELPLKPAGPATTDPTFDRAGPPRSDIRR